MTLKHWQETCDVKKYYLNHAGDEATKIENLLKEKIEMPFNEFVEEAQRRGVAL